MYNKLWTRIEEEDLGIMVNKGVSLKEMSDKLERTELAIKVRIGVIVLRDNARRVKI